MRLAITYMIFAVVAVGFLSYANAETQISVYQDNPPELQYFLDIVGEFRDKGIWLSYTWGQGIFDVTNQIKFVPEAYGEELNPTKKFETEVPFDYQDGGCTLVKDTPTEKQYDCSVNWKSSDHKESGEERSPAEDGCANGMDIDIRTGECKPHEQIKEEAQKECEVDPECPRGHYDPKPDPDPRMPKGYNPTDQELIKKINILLENPAQCYQGIGTTAGIQQIRNFEIPVIEVNGRLVLDTSVPHNSVDLRGYLGEIIANARECHAEQTLLNPQGGVLSSVSAIKGYCDALPTTTSIYHPMCGYNMKDHSTIAMNVPTWSQARVNAEANMNVQTSDVHPICVEGSYYSQSTKQVYCAEEKIPVIIHGSVVETQNDIEDSWKQYRADGGKSMAEELQKKTIQDKISELFRQMKALESQK